MLEHRRRYAFAASCGLAAIFATSAASAQECADIEATVPKPIFGAGGSAITATLRQVAAYLAGSDDPITVFWNDPGACTGYQQYLNDSITNTAVKYYNAAGTLSTCNASGHAADFAHMGNPDDFCTSVTRPSGFPEGYGTWSASIQTLNIIVDKDSSQNSISAAALYYLLTFGAGTDGRKVDPWINPANIVVRSPTSFAHQLLATAAANNSALQAFDDPGANGQPGSPRLGYRCPDQACVITQVSDKGMSDPESPIGYVSGSAADTADARSRIKTLAFQAHGQECGYWPDSSSSTLDKANVRNGRYELWSPGHFFARVDETGHPVNPDVERFIKLFTETEDTEALRRIILAGDIPQCAMNVQREGLLGPLSSYAPADPCACFFEVVATGRGDACQACEEDDDCSQSGAKCRRNYCEAY